MAEPIPTVDPALLAAQAKAGQAGVDAYNAAVTSMQQQRQQAVQQAMQEAALRGAPTGSAESVRGQITGPYDQRIASLTQAGAAYQADLSARDRRMADYNAATQAARSYIPQQVEQAVAPIRARGEYDVRQTEMEGQQRVAGINADLELQMARMAAAAQAAELAAGRGGGGGGGGGGGTKINQTELRSALTQEAAAAVGEAAAEVKRAQTANASGARLGKNIATLKRWAAQNIENPAVTKPRNQSYWDTMAAGYTRQAAQEYQQKAAAAPTPGQRELNIGQAANARRAAEQQIAGLQNRISQQARPLKAQRQQADIGYGRDIQQLRRENTSQYGWLTEAQVAGMTPFSQWAVQQAPGRFSSGTSSEQMILGAPYQTGTGAYSGEPTLGTNPYAAEVMNMAQRLAAGRMQDEGFDITDADIYGALGTKGTTAYDASRELAGQPVAAEEIAADEADRALAASMSEDELAAQEAETEAGVAQGEETARQILTQQKGFVPEARYGTPQEVLNVVGSSAYEQGVAQLEQIMADAEEEYEDLSVQDIKNRLREAGIPARVVELMAQFEL